MKKTCCILVNTCDQYEDAWYPFFRILEQMWPEANQFRIYLNTESKSYCDTFFNVKVLNILPHKSKLLSWGERLLDVIDRIDEEYILFMLEDFFLEDRIDNSKIIKILEWFSKDKLIAAITLIPTYDTEKFTSNNLYNENFGLIQRKRRTFFKLNASPTLYQKKVLEKYTLKRDTPWGWEYFGSIRTWHSPMNYYAMDNDNSIFRYDIKHGGAIHRGKWVGCSVRSIIKKYNIDIDLNKRGVVEDWLVTNPESSKHNLLTIIINRSRFLVEYMRGCLMK
jgi:hypothetical protein